MPTRFHYPVELTPEEDGGFIVSFPDLPEALTCGADQFEALAEAADCLEEALAGRITERMEIPHPSPTLGRPTAAPGATIAAKAALWSEMRTARMTNTALATSLGVLESEVRRMLDPRHATKIGRLEEALAVFGKRLVVSVEAA
jgi:antitoxin HicB